MAEKFVNVRNLKFMLYEVFDVESLISYPYYQEHDREIFDLVIETGLKMGKDLLYPTLREMDRNPPELINGQIKVHPMVRNFLKECGEGGWLAANTPFEQGGQQLPLMVSAAFRFILSAANYSAGVFPLISSGAVHLIHAFGSQTLIDTYTPKILSGEWQGTMALTEPQAGSSLSDITTTAEPTDQGYYKIRGQKIFISAADHDGVDNVINLMLAKIKGSPPGVKGISLFVVPKKRLVENGTLISNDVSISGIYHKLGYRGTPLTQLSLGENDDCRGFLVGEPHEGLTYMFQMMNETRIDVGLGAAAVASAAYHAALEYTRERPQGRRISAKDPTTPQIPIIEHPDVKRMLLLQRSVVEGSLSLILQCAQYGDMVNVTEGGAQERFCLLLDLLTPVAKSYPAEMGIYAVSQAMQCLGGYGYCDEFPIEQHYRDARIHPIHEGTTGIHGLDLLGRKVVIKNGLAFQYYLEEVNKTIKAASEDSALLPYAKKLKEALEILQDITSHLVGFAKKGEMEKFLADATLYLELFGIVSIGWQWLTQGLAIQRGLKSPSEEGRQFYQGKFFVLRYFFSYELPKTQWLASRLKDHETPTVEVDASLFTD